MGLLHIHWCKFAWKVRGHDPQLGGFDMVLKVIPHLLQSASVHDGLGMVDAGYLKACLQALWNSIEHGAQGAHALLEVPHVRPAEVTPAANDEVLASPPLEVHKVLIRENVIAARAPAEFNLPNISCIIGTYFNLRRIERPQSFKILRVVSVAVSYPVKFRIDKAVTVLHPEPRAGSKEVACSLQRIWLGPKESCQLIVLPLDGVVAKNHGHDGHLANLSCHPVNAVVDVVAGVDVLTSIRSDSGAVIQEAHKHALLGGAAEYFFK